jgi:hypothetical protein
MDLGPNTFSIKASVFLRPHLMFAATVNFFFAGNFCGLPGKYLNLPVGLWQKVGKSNSQQKHYFKL